MSEKNLKTKVFSGLVWKFGERITSQLVTFVVSIVLARLLSPKEYGSIALVMVFITIAEVFVTSGFGSALIQKLDVDNVDFSSVLYFNIAFSIVIYIVLFLVAPSIASFYDDSSLSLVLRVLSLRIPIAAINSVQQAYVSKKMIFKRFFWSTLFGTLFSGVVGIAMAYSGCGIWAIVAQYLVNTFVNTIVLWFTVEWRPELVFSLKRIESLISYGWKILVSALLDTVYTQVRSLVIGKVYTSEDLAIYNKGQQFPSLIITNINTSISSVIFPALSENQNDREKVKTMTRRAIKTSSFIIWPMMIGLGVVATPLIGLMLTDKWLPCVPYLQIACFTYGLWPIHTANLEAIKAVGRSDLFLKLEIIKKVIGMVLLLLVMRHGVMAIALSLVVTSIISCFINAYPNRSLLGYTYWEQFRDMIPSFVLAIVMGLIIYPISMVVYNRLVLIALQIIIGALVYAIGAKVLKFDSLDYIINAINIKIKR